MKYVVSHSFPLQIVSVESYSTIRRREGGHEISFPLWPSIKEGVGCVALGFEGKGPRQGPRGISMIRFEEE